MIALLRSNLVSPPVLAFLLGVGSVGGSRYFPLLERLRSPAWMSATLSSALLLAVGVKGGVALAGSRPADLWGPGLAALVLGCLTPVTAFAVLRRLGRFPIPESAAIAAHYGSVSVLTFTAALAFLGLAGVSYEGFMPTILAFMEAPGIVVALVLAHRGGSSGGSWTGALGEVLGSRSFVLLGAGLALGFGLATAGVAVVTPAFQTAFLVLLSVFLLEMGALAGRHLRGLRELGPFLIAFGTLVPLAHGVLGVLLGWAAGLSLGGTTLMGVLGASASYIAAPAAIRIALPKVNPALYLTTSLGITFPLNLTLGIPAYYLLASALH